MCAGFGMDFCLCVSLCMCMSVCVSVDRTEMLFGIGTFFVSKTKTQKMKLESTLRKKDPLS